MSLQNRIRELRHRHAELDTRIEQKQKQPSADPLAVKQLKREKLRLKDHIASLEGR